MLAALAPFPVRRALAGPRRDADRSARGGRGGPAAVARRGRRRLLPGAGSPGQPGRNVVSAFVDAEHGRLRVPGGPPRPVLPARRCAGSLPLGAEAGRDLRGGFREGARRQGRVSARVGRAARVPGGASPCPSHGRWRSSPSARSTGRARGAISTSSTTTSTRSRRPSPPASRSSRRDSPRGRRGRRRVVVQRHRRVSPRPARRGRAPAPHARGGRPPPLRAPRSSCPLPSSARTRAWPATRRRGSSTRRTSSAAASR